MKSRNNQDNATIATSDIDTSDRTFSSARSFSPRRPQEFYYDIPVTPRTQAKIAAAHCKNAKNRLKAFELASRALRDVPVVSYDPLDAFSTHRLSDPTSKTTSRPASTREKRTTISNAMLDFGNSSDSRVLQLRRESVRQQSVPSCDPSRSWGELTHHRSTSTFPALPRSPRRYS